MNNRKFFRKKVANISCSFNVSAIYMQIQLSAKMPPMELNTRLERPGVMNPNVRTINAHRRVHILCPLVKEKYKSRELFTKLLIAFNCLDCRQDDKCYKVGEEFEDKANCLKMRCESSSEGVRVTESGCRQGAICRSHNESFLETESCKSFVCDNGQAKLKDTGKSVVL